MSRFFRAARRQGLDFGLSPRVRRLGHPEMEDLEEAEDCADILEALGESIESWEKFLDAHEDDPLLTEMGEERLGELLTRQEVLTRRWLHFTPAAGVA